MTAAWDRVRTILEAQGHRTRDGLTRAVTARTCRYCGAKTLAGIAGNPCGLPVHVDPAPLSPLGEALAVLTGRPTFSLRQLRTARRLELDLRDSFHLRTPAGTADYDVVAGHVCGADPLPATTSNLPAPTPRRKETACPF